MFDKFGEFDSAADLNLAAEGLYNEGDTSNIYVLAEENGIDREMTDLYIAGEIPYLSDDAIAAIGKLDIETKEAEIKYGDTAVCVAEYLKSLCDRPEFARMVRRKGKSLADCLKEMHQLAEKRVKERKGSQCVCIPPSEGFKLVREYYKRESKTK